jgi:hypothetical protein
MTVFICGGASCCLFSFGSSLLKMCVEIDTRLL